jgi:SAM-dependent methyltransferase
MTTTEQRRGTAGAQGSLWGARARDWADHQEPAQRQIYEHVLELAEARSGTALLDVGCGAGGFSRLAAGAGAVVTGIDAAEPLVAIARERVPAGRFSVGDIQYLPYDDGAFDVVAGVNSFQYAADPVAALAEARRVARPGGTVLAVVWGREEQTELVAVLRALRPLLPPAPEGAPGPFALSYPGALEELVAKSGLTLTAEGYFEATFTYPDEAAMLTANLAAGPAVLAARTSGEDAVAATLRDALAPFRTASGSYRIESEWRYVTAAA